MQIQGRLLGAHFVQHTDLRRKDPLAIVESLARQAAAEIPAASARILAALDGPDRPSSLGELFQAALLGPLEALKEGGKPGASPTGKTMALCVDGIDEATDRRVGGNPVADLIRAHLLRLPAWIRVVASGRPESDVVGVAEGLAACRPTVLEPTSDENKGDVRAFIEGSLSSRLEAAEREAVVEELMYRSEGVIAWVARVVAMCHDGKGGIAAMRLGQLPKGLGALYRTYFDRQVWRAFLPLACALTCPPLSPSRCVLHYAIAVALTTTSSFTPQKYHHTVIF